jgi:hypothetical protein
VNPQDWPLILLSIWWLGCWVQECYVSGQNAFESHGSRWGTMVAQICTHLFLPSSLVYRPPSPPPPPFLSSLQFSLLLLYRLHIGLCLCVVLQWSAMCVQWDAGRSGLTEGKTEGKALGRFGKGLRKMADDGRLHMCTWGRREALNHTLSYWVVCMYLKLDHAGRPFVVIGA